MRTRTLAGIVVLLFGGVALLSSAQGKAETGGNAGVYAELEKAPEKYRGKANPLANDPEAVAAGSILFEEHCEDCHGEGGKGGKKAPSLRAKEVQDAAPGTLFWVLTNGVVRKKMPVWSKLPEPQRWQLVSYLKSLGVAEGTPGKSNSKP